MSVEERDALRSQVLNELYDADAESPRTWFDARNWAATHDMPEGDVVAAFDWLYDHGFADRMAWGMIGITPLGRDEIEEKRRPPSTPAIDYSAELTLTEFRQLEGVVAEIRAFVEEHEDQLGRDNAADLRAQAETIEAQSRSPRPRRSIIGGAVAATRWVASEAVGGLVGAGALAGVQALAMALGV